MNAVTIQAPVVEVVIAVPVISFVNENSERYEINVNGQFFGHACANWAGGLEVFRGRFPNAQRFPQADGNGLDEVRRLLTKALAF